MSVCSLMVSAYVSKAVEGVTAADVKTTIGATRILAAYVSITQCVMYFTSVCHVIYVFLVVRNFQRLL